MLKAHRRFPRVKEKLPRQPDKQHGRATTKGYSYYSIARNEKKGAYTMSTNEMTSKIRELIALIIQQVQDGEQGAFAQGLRIGKEFASWKENE